MNTPLVMLAAVILGLAFPGSTAQAQCGGEGQTPCKIWERVPSCNSGMKEDFGQGKCVKMATPCGAVGQRPCMLNERILSCNPGSYEDLGKGLCVKNEPCGAADQRPCRINERVPSCDAGMYEDFGKGKCLLHGDHLRDGFEKCVHVPGVSKENGVQLRTWGCVNLAHLTWEKLPMDKEDKCSERPSASTSPAPCLHAGEVAAGYQFFRLKNRVTGKCAAVHAGQTDHGSTVVQWDCGSEKNYQWAWDAHGRLHNRESGMCLHSESGGHNVALTLASCRDLDVPNGAQWKVEKTFYAQPTETYPFLVMNGLKRCLGVLPESEVYTPGIAPGVEPKPPGYGGRLRTWDCTNLNEARWAKTNVSGDQAYFWLKQPRSGKCAALVPGKKNEHWGVVQADCGGEPQGQNFHWRLDGLQLVNRESGKCLRVLEVFASGINDPAIIDACPRSVPANEKWTLVKPGGETYR